MNDLEKEVHELSVSQAVDWKKIKEILCGVASSLQLVCSMLPSGMIKNIVCGIAGVLNMICQSLPG